MKVGSHVRVSPDPKIMNGEPHPHGGRCGVVGEFFRLSGPIRAAIQLDPSEKMAGNYIIVSVMYLEEIP